MRHLLVAAVAVCSSVVVPAPVAARHVHHHRPIHTAYTTADKQGGYYVLAFINGEPLPMMVDSGASAVNVPEDMADALDLPAGGEKASFVLADGSEEKCRIVSAKTIQVGEVVVHDVDVSICQKASLLLGDSFLNKVRTTIVGGHLTFQDK